MQSQRSSLLRTLRHWHTRARSLTTNARLKSRKLLSSDVAMLDSMSCSIPVILACRKAGRVVGQSTSKCIVKCFLDEWVFEIRWMVSASAASALGATTSVPLWKSWRSSNAAAILWTSSSCQTTMMLLAWLVPWTPRRRAWSGRRASRSVAVLLERSLGFNSLIGGLSHVMCLSPRIWSSQPEPSLKPTSFSSQHVSLRSYLVLWWSWRAKATNLLRSCCWCRWTLCWIVQSSFEFFCTMIYIMILLYNQGKQWFQHYSFSI